MKRLQIRFPVRAHAWLGGVIPGWGVCRRRPTEVSFSPPPTPRINKLVLRWGLKEEKQRWRSHWAGKFAKGVSAPTVTACLPGKLRCSVVGLSHTRLGNAIPSRACGACSSPRAQHKSPLPRPLWALSFRGLESHFKDRPAGNLLTLKPQPAVGLEITLWREKAPHWNNAAGFQPSAFYKRIFLRTTRRLHPQVILHIR